MKTALVFGSTGLVGGHLVKKLIKSNNYSKIKIFVRSDPEIKDSKIEIINTDFYNLENHKEDIKGDHCFVCIGTTKKNAPKENEYRRIEYNIPVKIAKLAKLNSVKSFLYISSGFANPKSTSSYLKNKGEVEEELKKLNFLKLGIFRPSFLMGNRKEVRLGEKIGTFFFKLISPVLLGFLSKIKPIHSDIVAEVMIKVANESLQQIIFESNEIANLIKNRN